MQRNSMYENSNPAPAVEKRTDSTLTTLGKARVDSASRRENSSQPIDDEHRDYTTEKSGTEIAASHGVGSSTAAAHALCSGPEKTSQDCFDEGTSDRLQVVNYTTEKSGTEIAASHGVGSSTAAAYALCTGPEKPSHGCFDEGTYDHLHVVNGQSQDVQPTTTAGSLPPSPVYQVCGGPDNTDTYSHLTTKRGSWVSAATISASSFGVQVKAGELANRRGTVPSTDFGADTYSEPADSLLTDNMLCAGRGVSSTSQSDTYSQPVESIFVDIYSSSTHGTFATGQCDTYSQPAGFLLEGKQVATGCSRQVDDATGIPPMASSDGSTVTEDNRASTEDEPVLHNNCADPATTETNVYSQPSDALIHITKGPIPCDDVIEATSIPMFPGYANVTITMPTTNIAPTD